MFWNAVFCQPPVHVNDFSTESYKFLTVVSLIFIYSYWVFFHCHNTQHDTTFRKTTRFHLQVSNTNITDKTYFNIISFKGSLREQHQWCTRTTLWPLRLKLYGISGRVTSEWLILKLFEGHSRGLIGYCPRIYWERRRKTVRHVRALGQDSNRTSSECKSTTLLFGYYWYVVWAF